MKNPSHSEGDAALLFKKVRRLELISNKVVESLLAGNYRSVFKGPGIEFDETREYVEGDDVRLIDWNVSSRLDGVFTKTFREERELTLFMIVDVSPSVYDLTLDSARREIQSLLFSILTFAGVRNNDRIGGLFFSDQVEAWVPPRKGRRHALRLIQDLLSFKPVGTGSNLEQALRGANEGLPRRGICVIISDFKTAGFYRELALLARRHDVIAIRVNDPVEDAFPSVGLIQLEDPETGKTILAHGRGRAFRRQFKDFWEVDRRAWARECGRLGVAVLEIGVDEDPGVELVRFFRRRRKK